MAETVIRSRIDAEVKLEAQLLLEKLGLSMSEAIRLFLNQVILEKGLPFQVKLPPEAAEEHDRWFRTQVEAALTVAEDPATAFIPHDQVRNRWTKKRQRLAARSNKEPNA